MIFFITVLLLIFSYDFTKMMKQNKIMIEQNNKIIKLLEDMKNK
ncbi:MULTISPECIES: hypothetical protein [Bacillus cereus group]|nr:MULTISPECIES: hypothetical protein [Bacillus cereus group]